MKNTIKMLKMFGTVAIAVLMAFSMTSCDDGDKDPSIVGSWGNNAGVWTFSNNGTATFAASDVTINYTYSIDGTTLSTINTGNNYAETWSFSISGSTLTMTRRTPSAGTAQTFTKQ
jgi:uncharacterized lipoprotein YehR (DUF1307 family)